MSYTNSEQITDLFPIVAEPFQMKSQYSWEPKHRQALRAYSFLSAPIALDHVVVAEMFIFDEFAKAIIERTPRQIGAGKYRRYHRGPLLSSRLVPLREWETEVVKWVERVPLFPAYRALYRRYELAAKLVGYVTRVLGEMLPPAVFGFRQERHAL